jgi:hypothetical protein
MVAEMQNHLKLLSGGRSNGLALRSEGKGHTFESCRVRRFFLILQWDMRARTELQFCVIRVSKRLWWKNGYRMQIASFGTHAAQ